MSDKARMLPVPARIEHLAGLSLAATFVVSQPDVLESFQKWMATESAKKTGAADGWLPSGEEIIKATENLRKAVDWADQQVFQFIRSASLWLTTAGGILTYLANSACQRCRCRSGTWRHSISREAACSRLTG